jgi:Ca-activated chloride channel family protein
MDSLRLPALAALIAAALATASAQEPESSGQQSFRFRTGVELINVTATVSDGNGRFVSGLQQEDFRVYEDDQERPITHFTSERVPVSLGIVLDTSGSMDGEKMLAARQALQRFLFDLLGPEDEVFLYRFDTRPERLHGWTSDRALIAAELRRIRPRGATTLYDAVADALPLAATGRHRKKALLIISDGNDTSSYTRLNELKKIIRESEVLVYAIGIDALGHGTAQRRSWFSRLVQEQRRPIPIPFPIPGQPRPVPGGPRIPPRYPPTTPPPHPGIVSRGDEPVNVGVLRDITDDTGGRTEIIRQPRDLDPATAGIADELSKQYFIGYPASGLKDGRWHSIRVEVRNRSYVVRARRGYFATP